MTFGITLAGGVESLAEREMACCRFLAVTPSPLLAIGEIASETRIGESADST